MEEHLFYLQRLCRICGEILSGRVTYLVSDHLEELTELYKVHFAGDTSGKEPSSFCNTCYSRVKNSSKFTPKVWFPHEGPDCTTCCHYNMKKKGGRPKKIKNRGGRPKQQVEVSPKTMTTVRDYDGSQSIKTSSSRTGKVCFCCTQHKNEAIDTT